MTHTVESLMALAFDAMDAARVWAVKNDDLTLASLGRKREALRAALTEALEQPADCNALMLVKDCLMQANEQVNGPTFMVEPVPQAVPVAWADDNAMQGKVGNVCSTAAKRYWEKSDLVDKKNAELHKHPLYAAPVAVQAVPAETRTLWECRGCGHLHGEKVSSCDCMENGANEYNEWTAAPKGVV